MKNKTALTPEMESMLRQNAAMHRGCLDEINKLLIAGGCEPEPDSILTDAKVLVYGVGAKTTNFFKAVGSGFKNAFNSTKAAGEEAVIQAKINRQIEEQMTAMRKELAEAMKK